MRLRDLPIIQERSHGGGGTEQPATTLLGSMRGRLRKAAEAMGVVSPASESASSSSVCLNACRGVQISDRKNLSLSLSLIRAAVLRTGRLSVRARLRRSDGRGDGRGW